MYSICQATMLHVNHNMSQHCYYPA